MFIQPSIHFSFEYLSVRVYFSNYINLKLFFTVGNGFDCIYNVYLHVLGVHFFFKIKSITVY